LNIIQSWTQALESSHHHTLQSFKTFLSKNLDQNKLKNALFLEKAVTVFSAQALRTYQQHTFQSFKTTFLSRNLDQNMYKNTLFFEKIWKIAVALPPLASGGWELRPQTPRVVTPITCHSYFLEGVCSANVITVQKEQKEVRNSNNVLLLSFISSSNSAQGTLANTTGSDFSAS